MKDQNIALVKTLYDAFSKGDIQTILNHLAENVDWQFEGPASIPYAGKFHGKQDVPRFFQGLGTEENQKLTMDEFYADGNVVFTAGRFAATVKSTGKRFDARIAHLFQVEAGKVTRFVDFGDTAAMAAAHAKAAGGVA